MEEEIRCKAAKYAINLERKVHSGTEFTTEEIEKAYISGACFVKDKMDKEFDALLSLVVDLINGDDCICEKLISIEKENKQCLDTCQNLTTECIKRFLKYYERK